MQHSPRTPEWTGLPGYLTSRVDELQKLLIEERRNYRTLKQLMNRLHEANVQEKNELKCLRSEKQSLQDQITQQTAAYENILLAKTKEVEEVRRQQEIDSPVREMCRQLEEEAEKYRSGYNQVRYECIRLQSQLEQQREEHARSLESQRLLYQSETSLLQKDKEELVARLQGLLLRSDDKKTEALLKERVQLKVRLQGLEAEVAELHAQEETARQRADGVRKQLTESQHQGDSLGTKLEAVRAQLGKTQKELRLRSEENCSLGKELHEAGREIHSLGCQIENLKFSHKQEVNSIKLKFKLSQGELENEKNHLQGQTEVFQTEVELLRGEITQLKAALMEKEEEMCRKVHLVHEEGAHKAAQLHKERSELEKHISQMDAAAKAKIGEWQECLSKAKHREESMSEELRSLVAKLQQQSAQILELERCKGEMADLRQRNDKLGEQLRKVSTGEDEQRKTNEQLRETLERVREELKTTQVQAERIQQKAESQLQDSQKEFREVNGKLQQKHAEAKERLKRAAAAQKERRMVTEYREKKLRGKIQLLEAQLEEQRLEVSLVKKNVSSCEQKYERKLKNLLQAKREFERLLFGGPGGDGSYATAFVTGSEGVFPRIPPDCFHVEGEQHPLMSEARGKLGDLECPAAAVGVRGGLSSGEPHVI